MLTSAGVKLLDFGLAKLRDLEREETVERSTQSLELTEQGTGSARSVYGAGAGRGARRGCTHGHFCAGVILYEMCAGRPPFEGRSRASLMAAILTHEPQSLSSLRGGVPASLDRIVRKCLAKDPNDRWQSASDLAAALLWSRDDGGRAVLIGARRRAAAVQSLGGGGADNRCAGGAFVMWMLVARGVVGRTPALTPEFIPITFRNGTVSAAASHRTENGDLQCRVERRPLRVVHDPARQPRVASARHPRRQAARRVIERRPDLSADVMTRSGSSSLHACDSCQDCTDRRRAARDSRRRDCSRLETGQRRARRGPPGPARVSRRQHHSRTAPVQGCRWAGRQETRARRRVEYRRARSLRAEDDVILRMGNTITLAWSPSGDEVWSTANRVATMFPCGRCALSRWTAGSACYFLPRGHGFDPRRLPRWPCPYRYACRKDGCSCLPPGESQPRDLSWLDSSAPEALSRDGGSVLFSEMPEVQTVRFTCENRRLGTPSDLAMDLAKISRRMGMGSGNPGRNPPALAPHADRAWIGITLPPGPLVARREANFLPNGRQIVFGGQEKDRGRRIYVQDIDGGSIRAISPENVGTEGLATPTAAMSSENHGHGSSLPSTAAHRSL